MQHPNKEEGMFLQRSVADPSQLFINQKMPENHGIK